MNEQDLSVIDRAIEDAIAEAERTAAVRDAPVCIHPRTFQLGATATIADRSAFDVGTPDNPRELGDPGTARLLEGILQAGLSVRV